MATGGVSNMFECAVCLNSMLDKTPRGLMCFHSFCEECLIPLIKNKQISCPSCRRVTNVEEGIKELPVNFYLCQMKETAFPKADESQSERIIDSQQLCEICTNAAGKYKCIDCPKILCKICKSKHASIRKYKEHSVLDLCTDHRETIEKLCKKCQIRLCASCISKHTEHAEHMENYDAAQEELKNDVAHMKQTIAIAENEYDDNFDETIRKHKTHMDNLELLKERRRYYTEKVEEADKLIQETEDNIGKFKELEIEYEKTRFECEDLKLEIEKLDDETAKFQKLSLLKKKVKKTVNNLKQKFDEYEFPSFVLCKHQDSKFVIPRPPRKVQNLQKVKLLLTKSKICRNYNTDIQLASVGDDILAITDEKPSHVVRINQQGDVLDHYYPTEEGKVIGVSIYNEKIYVVQEKYINVVNFEDKQSPTIVYRPDIKVLGKVCVVDNQNFIISKCKNPGSIYLFNTIKNSTVPVVQDLNCPSYINITYTEDGPRYIITESGAHCVRVYSDSWTLLYTLGKPGSPGSAEGEFNYPLATAVTEQNTILIADTNNKRVCHFTLNGTFLSNVLTKVDGIGQPVGIVYKNNRLWVNTFTSGKITCFQLE